MSIIRDRMQSAAPCSICKEGGHRESKCPALYDPLKEGFFSGGGGGGGGHSHDDDEERAGAAPAARPPAAVLNKNLKQLRRCWGCTGTHTEDVSNSI